MKEPLSLGELIELSKQDNIAAELEPNHLGKIAIKVCEGHEDDLQTMDEWCTLTKQGLDLVKPPTDSRSEPWEGAANFKSPIIQEAAYKFGERSSKELLRPKDLVKVEVIGQDKDGSKEAKAERISTYQSYQLNHEMPEWRQEQRDLLYRLPNMGTIFKDTFFDPIKGRQVSETIHYPNFSVDQSTTSMVDLCRFTKIRVYERDDIETFKRSEVWLDEDILPKDQEDDIDYRTFLEQYTTLDLDYDGMCEPYIVTVHQASKKVMRIVSAYEVEDIILKVDGDFVGAETVYGPLTDEFGALEDEDGEPLEGIEGKDDYEIIRFDRKWSLTKYGFLPSSDGTFLDVGYYQIMSSLVHIINSGTNQLVNAGVLSNLQGGYLAKGVRKKMGRDRFKPGEFKQTDISPTDLQNSIFTLPFKEPSQTLLALVETFKADAQKLGASADMSDVFGPNSAASTVLGLLDEAMSSTTSLMQNVRTSMGQEFKVMYRLNGIYADPAQYKRVVDDQAADYREDFSDADLDIMPTANPEYSNQIRRVQTSQILMGASEQLVGMGANGNEIGRNFVDAIAPDDVDKIFPPPTEEYMAAQTNAMNAQAEQSKQQAKWFAADADRMIADAQSKRIDAQIAQAELPANLQKIRAETIKLLEQAESEQAQNQIDRYTADIEALDKSLQAIEAIQNGTTETASPSPREPGGTVIPMERAPNIGR